MKVTSLVNRIHNCSYQSNNPRSKTTSSNKVWTGGCNDDKRENIEQVMLASSSPRACRSPNTLLHQMSFSQHPPTPDALLYVPKCVEQIGTLGQSSLLVRDTRNHETRLTSVPCSRPFARLHSPLLLLRLDILGSFSDVSSGSPMLDEES